MPDKRAALPLRVGPLRAPDLAHEGRYLEDMIGVRSHYIPEAPVVDGHGVRPQFPDQRLPGSGGQRIGHRAGTFLDGVPEGVVLGLSVLHQGAPSLGTVAAFFLANIPEALSSSAGMRRAEWSSRYVLTSGLESP